jgi:methyl coenzyme M reductase subunit C-like uncharacterized protein (methanogenesis marker protein 7)
MSANIHKWFSKLLSMLVLAVLTFANEAFPPQETGFSEVVASPSVYIGKIGRKQQKKVRGKELAQERKMREESKGGMSASAGSIGNKFGSSMKL